VHEKQTAAGTTGETLARQAGTRAEWAGESAEEARARARREQLDRERLAEWQSFMREERVELESRKDGQLAGQLGAPLPGESPETLRRLVSEDQRQAEEGLVALMSNGKVTYKRLEELAEGDKPARVAANSRRAGWLKERRDGWLGRAGGST